MSSVVFGIHQTKDLTDLSVFLSESFRIPVRTGDVTRSVAALVGHRRDQNRGDPGPENIAGCSSRI